MTRRAVWDVTPPHVLEALKEARQAGSLESMLMARHFGLRAAVEESKRLREERATTVDKAVAERIARGGRDAPKPSDLRNNLPEAKPQPVPGVYEQMGCTAQAMGYMGLFEDDGLADDGA
jgi:hypothetical protein